jgi:5-formyltetrahydrofolate cyclo-ligase
MVNDSLKVVPFRLPLKKYNFGVKEPKNSFFYKNQFDLAIIPVIGVDIDFKRIGYGKGFYDRFFATLPYKPIKIFVQTTLCFSYFKVTSLYDIQANYIVTKEGVLWKQQQ